MPLLSANAHRALAAASSLAVAGLLTLSAPSAHAASGDRDGDKMPNRWESAHGLNPYRADARGDADRDGLRNLAEYRHHTDPSDEDTDNDGVTDGVEDDQQDRADDAADGDDDSQGDDCQGDEA